MKADRAPGQKRQLTISELLARNWPDDLKLAVEIAMERNGNLPDFNQLISECVVRGMETAARDLAKRRVRPGLTPEEEYALLRYKKQKEGKRMPRI